MPMVPWYRPWQFQHAFIVGFDVSWLAWCGNFGWHDPHSNRMWLPWEKMISEA